MAPLATSAKEAVNQALTLIAGLAHVSGDDDLADLAAAVTADVTGGDNNAIVRTSASVLTITLPPAVSYAIGSDEVLSLTVPAAMMETTASAVAATPNLTIANSTTTAALTGTIQSAAANEETDIEAGGSTIIITLSGDNWAASDGADGTNPNDYLSATANALIGKRLINRLPIKGALVRRNSDFVPWLYRRIGVKVFSIHHGFHQSTEAGRINSADKNKVRVCSP